MPEQVEDPALESLWLLLDAAPSDRLEAEARRAAVELGVAPETALDAARVLAGLRDAAHAEALAQRVCAALPARTRGRPWVLAAGLLAAALVGFSRWGVPANPTLHLAASPTRVSPRVDRDGVARMLAQGEAVVPGDTLVLDAPATLYGEGGQLVLDEGTRLAWLPVAASGALRFRLERGRVYSSLHPGEPFALETSAGTVVVTGTEWMVDVPPAGAPDPTVFAAVRAGAIRLVNALGSVEVPAGCQGWLAIEAPPRAAPCTEGILAACFLWTESDDVVRRDLARYLELANGADPALARAASARLERAAVELPDMRPRLDAALADPRPGARAAAARAVLGAELPGWEDTLRATLADSDADVATRVFEALGERQVRPLHTARLGLDSPHAAVRLAAIRVARRERLTELLERLDALVGADPDPRVRSAAIDAAAAIR